MTAFGYVVVVVAVWERERESASETIVDLDLTWIVTVLDFIPLETSALQTDLCYFPNMKESNLA